MRSCSMRSEERRHPLPGLTRPGRSRTESHGSAFHVERGSTSAAPCLRAGQFAWGGFHVERGQRLHPHRSGAVRMTPGSTWNVGSIFIPHRSRSVRRGRFHVERGHRPPWLRPHQLRTSAHDFEFHVEPGRSHQRLRPHRLRASSHDFEFHVEPGQRHPRLQWRQRIKPESNGPAPSRFVRSADGRWLV